MSALPVSLRLFITAVVALGGVLSALALTSARLDEPARFLLFLLLSALASVLKMTVPLPRALAQHGLTMSLSFTMNFAALLLLGVHEATLIAVVGVWSQITFKARQKNPLHRTLFSMAAIVVTIQATGRVYGVVGGASPGGAPIWADEIAALIAAACTYFIVNSGLVAIAIALSVQQRLSQIWTQNFLTGWINHLLAAVVAVLIARGVNQTRYWLLPVTTLLLYLTYRTYSSYSARIEAEQKAVQQVSALHESTLEALALAIDAKDRHSRAHLRRLQAASVALARAEGLNDTEVQAVKTAALLHDIGMLAVPQHILSKPGRLSDEELRKVRSHPQVGADILRYVPFPSPVAPLVESHHERWDGTGYPDGLKGEAIPLGARILAVADRFDAFTSERADADVDEAVRVLQSEAGVALDPRLVARFVELLPTMDFGDAGMPSPAALEAVSPSPRRRVDDQAAWAARTAATLASSPFEHIALAHREVYTLYQLAQALNSCLSITDAMVQLTSRLGALVPFSTCALFLRDDARKNLSCRFVTGPGALVLQPMRVPIGAGPIGWVVDKKSPLINVSLVVVGVTPSEEADTAGALRSSLICPLLVDSDCVGALVVAHPEPSCYHDEHRRVLEQVAEHAAGAIQNSLRFERTNEAAITDRLTGLANSRGLATAFESALAGSGNVAPAPTLAVLMIDVDEFKAINDTYGHAAGDRALREVARVLSQSVRARDICSRYAGDEFVLVLVGCGGPEAERRARDLQALFEGVRFAPEPGRLEPLHISVGAAAFPGDAPSLDTLLVIADRQMYADKQRRKRARANASGYSTPHISA